MIHYFRPFQLLLLFCLMAFSSKAQNGDVYTTNNAKESLQVAQQLLSEDKMDKAIKQLKYTIKIKDDLAVAHRLLGKAYYDSHQFDEAKKALEKSFDLDKKLSRAAFYECGDCCLRLGDTEQADYYLGLFKEMKDKRYANANKESALEKSYEERYELKLKNIAYISSLGDEVPNLNVVALKNINSSKNEYLPSLSNDGEFLLFTRSLKGKQEDIYLSKKNGTGWGNENDGAIKINTDKNEGMAKFEPHNYKVFYAGCSRNEGSIDCDIFESSFIDGQLSDETELTGDLNSIKWDSQPSITCDAQTIYFASTRDGGFGGSDIWVSQRSKDGSWQKPTNMGATINTAGDEEAPFIAKDGEALYFSSDAHPGLGEGDFFVSFLKNGNWGKAINLGPPLNSPAKELGLFISDDAKTIFFSSERSGGEGGLDIYKADLGEAYKPKEVLPVALNLRDKDTGEVLTGKITLGYDNLRKNYETDKNGNVQLCLAANKAYSFRVSKKGYQFYVEAFFLEVLEKNKIQNILIAIEKEKEPEAYSRDKYLSSTGIQVFFENNSSEIDEAGKQKLKKLSELINKYDDWKITVTGFADSKGDKDYNKELSNKRASAVVAYLSLYSDKHMDQNIQALGKGEIETADTEEEKKKSRRVDVVLNR